ncbi:MAG: hypothetical protein E7315_03970 [Clostridiales bacterium]|nr:hypothetical protein [Clostridiales bacterium]
MKKEISAEEFVEAITADDIRKARETLKAYRNAKSELDARIKENEKWMRLKQWSTMPTLSSDGKKQNMPEPASAWLFNAIANKHADAMDNYPRPTLLPREANDASQASMLSGIIPAILEKNNYENTYSEKWWYKLKTGTGLEGVFWNKNLLNGLGDIEIKQLDILDLFWEWGVRDIQESKNVFYLSLVDNSELLNEYPHIPELEGALSDKRDRPMHLGDEEYSGNDKSIVVDWYYKKHTPRGTTVLHLCRFTADVILYATENDPLLCNRGIYDHGMYPFVLDKLFPDSEYPVGRGYVDIGKDTQKTIDKLNQAIVENALMSCRRRYFVREDGGIDLNAFADFTRPFISVAGSLDESNIREIETDPISPIYLSYYQSKIDELKEVCANRDFSQGGTTGGVTAASAIAALQESGSKLSRDMIKGSYRAFSKVVELTVELVRQFYDMPRSFRILGKNGEYNFVSYTNTSLIPQEQEGVMGGEAFYRKPHFDIVIKSSLSSPFSQVSRNELAKEFYSMGFFDPRRATEALGAMEMMEFEGKESVMKIISDNLEKYRLNALTANDVSVIN